MTVKAIYNIKMNRLILAPAGVVGSLSRLMQMNQIAVCFEGYLKGENTDSKQQKKKNLHSALNIYKAPEQSKVKIWPLSLSLFL